MMTPYLISIKTNKLNERKHNAIKQKKV